MANGKQLSQKGAEEILYIIDSYIDVKEVTEELFKKKPLGYEMKPELEIYTDGFNDGYNKANEWHYPSKGEYPEKGKEILLYTKPLGLIFGEFCEGYNNLWTSNRCDFTTEEIIAWIEKEKILPKESE